MSQSDKIIEQINTEFPNLPADCKTTMVEDWNKAIVTSRIAFYGALGLGLYMAYKKKGKK